MVSEKLLLPVDKWLAALVDIAVQSSEHYPRVYAIDCKLLVSETRTPTNLNECHVWPMPHCKQN